MNSEIKFWYSRIHGFHHFMSDIMNFGPFSCKRSYSNSCLENMVKNIVKNTVIAWKFHRIQQSPGAGRDCSAAAHPALTCSCSFIATCLTFSPSVWQSSNYQIQKILYYNCVSNYSCSCIFPSAKCYIGHQNSRTRSFFGHLAKIVYILISSILRQKHMRFSNFVFKTVEIRFVCNNHAFLISIFHLTIFLSTGETIFKIELFVLSQQ